jgi:hypothetical protein
VTKGVRADMTDSGTGSAADRYADDVLQKWSLHKELNVEPRHRGDAMIPQLVIAALGLPESYFEDVARIWGRGPAPGHRYHRHPLARYRVLGRRHQTASQLFERPASMTPIGMRPCR